MDLLEPGLPLYRQMLRFTPVFTGIVEGAGKVVSRTPSKKSILFVVDAGPLAEGVKVGESISNNGCCLTAVEISGSNITFDLLEETDAVTNLKFCQPGSLINIERSLRPTDRMGGHIVTGHVDCTAPILRLEKVKADYLLEVELPKKYRQYAVPKGCIAVDGMSLTVVDVTKNTFTIWLIPHTLEVTNLKNRKPGDELNLEFDLMAKYAEKILLTHVPAPTD